MKLFERKPKQEDLNKDYRYRDVYSDQKRERSAIGKVQPYWPWQVLAGTLAALFMVVAWLLLSCVMWVQAVVYHNMPSGWDPAVGSGIMSTVGGDQSGGGMGDVASTGDPSGAGTGSGQEGAGMSGGQFAMDGPIQDADTEAATVSGMTYQQFRDRYFTFYRKSGGIVDDKYMSNVDGNVYTETAVYVMWDNVCNGVRGEFDTMMAGRTADEAVPEEDVPQSGPSAPSIQWCVARITLSKILITLLVGLAAYALFDRVFHKKWEAQTQQDRVDDINQYDNDQHIQKPEEVQKAYDWFPDVGAHAPVQVSSLISHMALSNKGLKPVMLTKRADKDVLDKAGEVVYFKGEALEDEDGEIIQSKVPCIDEAFMDALWDASGLPKDKRLRKRFDPSAIPYNPEDKSRERLKGADTVADMINKYWTLPEYEPQRPAGAYIVDTEPVNMRRAA